MTVQDLVRLSLLTIGVLAEGENPSAPQLQDALTMLNLMIDTWSTERLFIYSIAQEVFSFVGGQQVYAMGPGGDFDTTRPVLVESVSVRVPYNTQPQTIDIPVALFNIDQWARISVKFTQSVWPTRCYVDYSYPAANIYFWPIPNEVNQVYITSFKPLNAFSTSESSTALPPGFGEALMYNLAVRLCPMYGKAASAEVLGLASTAKARLKISLSKFYLMRADDGLLPPDKVFNYLTGE